MFVQIVTRCANKKEKQIKISTNLMKSNNTLSLKSKKKKQPNRKKCQFIKMFKWNYKLNHKN